MRSSCHTCILLVPLYWRAFVPKGALTRRDPVWWAVYPLACFGYVLVRGQASGWYTYRFSDVDGLSWPRVGVNAVVIAVGFLAVGYAAVWLDGRIGRATVDARPT